jgi:hypothetical protein
MIQARGAVIFMIATMVWLNACSQSGSSEKATLPGHYTGSTPCDALIKSILGIPSGSVCEFMKWEMTLSKGSLDTGSYQFTVHYGESQPNTNGFRGGGTRIEVSGKYIISQGNSSGPGRKNYQLTGTKIHPELSLIEMDSNIFHFADAKGNHLLGNAGFSYVLNRMKE